MLNTEKLLPYELTNMYALLTEMLGVEEIEDHLTAEESMYVLTNQMRSFWSGSSVVSRTSGDACVVSERELLYFAEQRS